MALGSKPMTGVGGAGSVTVGVLSCVLLGGFLASHYTLSLLPLLHNTLTVVSATQSCSSETSHLTHDVGVDDQGRQKPYGDDLFGTLADDLIDEMKADNIEQYLRYLTQQGHMAGTKQDLDQALYLKKTWKEAGLDEVTLKSYEVQVSQPDLERPNKIYLMDERGEVKFTSSYLEDPLRGASYDDTIPPAFLAFSPPGVVVANELVYVNYGEYEDFLKIEAAGVKVEGRLVIAKFGKGFRGDKIQNAQRFNASGVILYTDPSDYHPDWQNGGASFPTTFWLPGSGIQRGTIIWRDGDPTTPDYPSIEGSHRLPENETDVPRIPAHCISYNDALKLLVNMGGEEVPAGWKGGLNITYRRGPQLARSGWTIKLEVNNVKNMAHTHNVMGLLRGTQEPDRYVIYSNHRDSWTYGSLDPSSGTAALMETVRAYGKMVMEGWRPRRSMVFASFGAGEYGFLGATELVEEYQKVLESRTVALLNVDLAIVDTYNLFASGTPLVHRVLKEATKKTPAPDPSLGYTTLWDHWTQRVRGSGQLLMDYSLASVSEHAPFYQRLGIPCSYMLWEINYEKYDWSDYPLYHTSFEDFEVMKTVLDPNFNYHLALGRLWALMGLALADARILPMDPTDETIMLTQLVSSLTEDYGQQLHQQGISLEPVVTKIQHFNDTATEFNNRINNLTYIPPLLARQYNDQLMMLERSFVDAKGSPVRPHLKNMVFGTSNFNQYASVLAPGVRDALWEATHCPQEDHACLKKWWQEVRQQLSVLHFVINSATITMRDISSL